MQKNDECAVLVLFFATNRYSQKDSRGLTGLYIGKPLIFSMQLLYNCPVVANKTGK